jgi:hypothetical protein
MSFFDAIDLEKLAQNPYCMHGPTVLFENVKEMKKFYSCSAIRNHKKCNFYQNQREFDEKELNKWFQTYKKVQIKTKTSKRLRLKLKSKNYKQRSYCKKCDRFIFNEQQKQSCEDEKHEILNNIKKSLLKEPTKFILNPLVDDDSNAVSCSFFIYKIFKTFYYYSNFISTNEQLIIFWQLPINVNLIQFYVLEHQVFLKQYELRINSRHFCLILMSAL